ncbi:MAG: hypothetical protein HQM14_18685 [SAR324 cluster bacterium]|nr:hypothetical protein [SAR324 cluster bacterium]
MALTRLLYTLYQVKNFADRHRSLAAFLYVTIGVILGDIFFHEYCYDMYAFYVERLFGQPLHNVANVQMDFTPEVWLALLSMVLGTLIIVISIASQSIPKLIDLYMEDWASLFYVWLLIISGTHATFIKLYGEIDLIRPSSRVFNIHFLLTISVVFAFPYIFYILKYTKPSNVINKIFQGNLKRIHLLSVWRYNLIVTIPRLVEEVQFAIFEAMNQLDDLLEYVSFKEPKADIIQNISMTIQEYVQIKSSINPLFFKVSPKVRSDISFKTMIGQFGDMEDTSTFYEQKCFRLMGNVYIKLLEEGQFDLASLCVGEMTAVGRVAIEIGDDALVDVLIIRFNTILRFGIKHGVKNNEPRNLYNAAFHYGRFIEALVDNKKVDHVKRCFSYLRIYGMEVFKHGKASPSMYFIVDVFAAEMKKVLISIYEKEWDVEVQNGLLNEILQVDNPPDYDKEDLDRGLLINNGVRVLQMGLALFYAREGKDEFVMRIITDVLDDLDVLGESAFHRVIDSTCGRLQFSGPTFWEDTDRGNLNIYYTPDQSEIASFKEMLYEHTRKKITESLKKRYSLTSEESQLLVQMSKLNEKHEIAVLVQSPEVFESTLLKLTNIDQGTLSNLVSLREKLEFHSDNPQLKIMTTRQIATSTQLEVSCRHMQKMLSFQGVVAFSYLNYFYLRLPQQAEGVNWQDFEKVTFRFKPRRQKFTYQFESTFEGPPMNNHLFKVYHVDLVKVIEG